MEFTDPVIALNDIARQVERELDNRALSTKIRAVADLVAEVYRVEKEYSQPCGMSRK